MVPVSKNDNYEVSNHWRQFIPTSTSRVGRRFGLTLYYIKSTALPLLCNATNQTNGGNLCNSPQLPTVVAWCQNNLLMPRCVLCTFGIKVCTRFYVGPKKYLTLKWVAVLFTCTVYHVQVYQYHVSNGWWILHWVKALETIIVNLGQIWAQCSVFVYHGCKRLCTAQRVILHLHLSIGHLGQCPRLSHLKQSLQIKFDLCVFVYHGCNRLQRVILQLHLSKVITPACGLNVWTGERFVAVVLGRKITCFNYVCTTWLQQ